MLERVVLVSELFDLVAQGALANVLDVVAFLGSVEALLRALFERPSETGSEAGGADEARRIFKEGVILKNSNELGLRGRRRR